MQLRQGRFLGRGSALIDVILSKAKDLSFVVKILATA